MYDLETNLMTFLRLDAIQVQELDGVVCICVP